MPKEHCIPAGGQRWQRALCGVLVALMSYGRASTCHASVFDDIGDTIAEVSGLRGVMRGLASGAGEGLRRQLEILIDEKVDPLLDRANALVAQRIDQADSAIAERIDQASHEMIRALREAEAALKGVVDHAGQTSIEVASRTIDGLFTRVDPLINKILCALAPSGRGLQIVGLPFAHAPDEIRVRRPAKTHCYRGFMAQRYRKRPLSAVFSGWQYYQGEMCEVEVNAADISPADPESLEKLKLAYERLAGLAARAICYAPTPTSHAELLTRELQYENKVRFLSRLLDGTTILLHEPSGVQ